MDVETLKWRPITNSLSGDYQLSLSHDGSKLVFSSLIGGHGGGRGSPPPCRHGVGASTPLFRQVGLATGIAVLGTIFASHIVRSPISSPTWPADPGGRMYARDSRCRRRRAVAGRASSRTGAARPAHRVGGAQWLRGRPRAHPADSGATHVSRSDRLLPAHPREGLRGRPGPDGQTPEHPSGILGAAMILYE